MQDERKVAIPIRVRDAHGHTAAGITTAAIAAFLLGSAPVPALAGFDVQVLNSNPSSGGTGSFDVVLTDTGGTFQVSGFSLELSVPSGSGVTFTGVGTNTTSAPYLFATLQSSPFSFDSFPTTNFIASDAFLKPPGYVTLDPGSEFGLAHITYSLATGAGPGPVTVSIVGNGTLLTDPNANTIPFTPVGGTINPTIIPEPTSLLLLSAGIIAIYSVSVFSRPC